MATVPVVRTAAISGPQRTVVDNGTELPTDSNRQITMSRREFLRNMSAAAVAGGLLGACQASVANQASGPRIGYFDPPEGPLADRLSDDPDCLVRLHACCLWCSRRVFFGGDLRWRSPDRGPHSVPPKSCNVKPVRAAVEPIFRRRTRRGSGGLQIEGVLDRKRSRESEDIDGTREVVERGR